MKRRTFLAASAAAVTAAAINPSLALAAEDNPLLATWTGPHGGVPPFDKVKVEHFKPAIMKGIELNRADIAAIAANPAPANFDNTLRAMQASGDPLTRAASMFNIYTSTLSSDDMQKVEQEVTPVFAAFGDEITQNEALFARVKAVYDTRGTAGLTDEQKRLAWRTYNNFARQGAALNGADKKRLAEINQRLATLYTTFSQNELADEEDYTILLEEGDLAGLPDSLKAAAAATAEDKGQKGKWMLTNTRSSVEPYLTYASKRDMRQKAWKMWISRGDNGNAHDNNKIITEILGLRAEKAKLLGFKTHAHWITAGQMSGTPDAAMDLMLRVWKPAVARVHEEVADMQKIADAEGGGLKIEPWDYRYYAEKVRKARYDLDQNEVKPYLQLDKMREAMHWAAGQIYGFKFAEIHDVPVCHPDVRVWEVTKGGKRVGLWYFDPYARAGKQSGAWMNEYRTQENFRGFVTPIVSNNCNFVKGKPGEAVLISWDDASTMFHEFGHALHGLNSNAHYPQLAGTNVARDFVEFPSQLNEHWLPTKEVLSRFAVHYQTGKPIPEALVKKIKNSETFNQGFITVEYLASALVDMKAHLAGATPIDPKEFEKATLAEIGMPAEIVMRHRMPHFGHIFSGDGYSAGYYDYIWADTLTADAAEAFAEAPGGFYDKPTAKRLHDSIMSVGDTIDAGEAFRRFRGRDVNVDALMRDRGFPVA
ncbi:peptidyl-dipeptidase Dcp [Caulobacter ginsengisoli]|uniref:Peptidyl-dipeptidase Dcp n=1 Tax=Caulobacter ginsengisoli TaxID=400775 RepID=A0ABU0IWB4_9CAUL|nr:M3 family metallopeptidase [Caulobacter ginsengisoli]MDQ0465675.1 peptidyl-dipeptidase Dcp [Caulobacter ginsengisoli]